MILFFGTVPGFMTYGFQVVFALDRLNGPSSITSNMSLATS